MFDVCFHDYIRDFLHVFFITTGTEAIMKQYPTPKALYSHLNSKSTRKHAVDSLKDIRGGNQLKSFGPVLAGSVCDIWRTIKN